jgi:hypothetical protein
MVSLLVVKNWSHWQPAGKVASFDGGKPGGLDREASSGM